MWTLNGISLPEWGFTGLQGQRANLSDDVVAWEHPVPRASSDPVLPPGAEIRIHRPDGVQWFRGTIVRIARESAGLSQSHRYTAMGPWYWSKKLFQIPWPSASTASPSLLRLNTHALLNVRADGSHGTARETILAILQQMIASGAPMQLGQILPGANEEFYPPITETRDRTCAELVRDQLRWAPSAVGWFDYATDPPTFHLRDASNLVAVTLPWSGSPTSETTLIDPRYDLQYSEVILKYEILQTLNNQSWSSWGVDYYPPEATGDKLDTYIQTIDMRGPVRSQHAVQIVCEPILANDPNWWRDKIPALDNDDITGLTVGSVERTGTLGLANELTRGSLAPWMGFLVEEDTIQARLTYTDQGESVSDVLFEVPVTATNATTGIYYSPARVVVGDPIPAGLAHWLWNQLSVLQYEGQHVITERASAARIGLGNLLNLSGGHPDWLTMRALVQGIQEDVETGRTRVTFGPRSHIGPTDVIAYYQGR